MMRVLKEMMIRRMKMRKWVKFLMNMKIKVMMNKVLLLEIKIKSLLGPFWHDEMDHDEVEDEDDSEDDGEEHYHEHDMDEHDEV